MHIIGFEAENTKRISAVRINPDPDASVVVLAGGNEEGKSSVLDAIEMALAGERSMPPEPIRRGAETARVVVDLGDIIVTRRFTQKGSSLVVENREGLRYSSPQAKLDALFNNFTFDPLAFESAKPAEQAGILRRLAGLDTKDLDDARKSLFDERTAANRDVARAKGAVATAESFPDVAGPRDTETLLGVLADADRFAAALAEAERQAALAAAALKTADDNVTVALRNVDDARRALARAEQDAEAAQEASAEAHATHAARLAEREQARADVPDTSAVRAEIATAQDHNRKAAANARRAQLVDELDGYQREAESLTKSIDEIDAAKAQRLADAKFPVVGLGISDAGVTWNGLPFEQASTAARTRVSVAIGMALNPKLKVLFVRNGNDLDAKNLRVLAEAAKEHGAQLWIERIAGGDGLQTVVIEDGAVQGVPVAPAAAGDVPVQPLDARAHPGDGDTAAAEAGAASAMFEQPANPEVELPAAKPPAAPRRGRRAVAGLFPGEDSK